MLSDKELENLRKLSPPGNSFQEQKTRLFGIDKNSSMPVEERMVLEREPKGALMTTLDYLTRPMYASAAFSNSLFAKKEGLEDALGHAWKGMMGKERIFYSDVLKNMGTRNKYVRAIAGFALDVGLDPVTYLTFGTGAGVKLGYTTLNKAGKVLLTDAMKKWLPKYTQKQLATTANKRLATELAAEEIRENVLKMALKNPSKYVEESALKIFGQKIPVLSNVMTWGTKKTAKGVDVLSHTTPGRWFGEKFIGDKFIVKHAKNLTPLQKNLLELQRQHYLIRVSTGYNMTKEFVQNFTRQFPKLKDREIIANLVERKPIGFVNPKFTDAATEIRQFIDMNITSPEMRQGLLNSFKKNYFPHIFPKKIAESLGKKVPHPIIGVNKFGRSRIFETLEDAKRIGYQPIEDAGTAVGIRYAYSQKLLALDDYIQKMVSTVGTRVSRRTLNALLREGRGSLPKGVGAYLPRNGARFYPLNNSAKPLSEQNLIKKATNLLQETEGHFGESVLKEIRATPLGKALKITEDLPIYILPQDVANMMNKKSPYLAREVSELGEFVDKIIGFWKASVTSWFPAFHARNAMSNVWLAYLGGLKNIMRFEEAFRLQKYGFLKRMGKDPADFVVKLGDKEFKASQLYQVAGDMDILSGAWYGRELTGGYERELLRQAGVKKTIKARVGEITLEKPRKVGTAVENNARLSLFLDRIAKGDDFHSAATHTKKFLFDYGDLTDSEKQHMRRLVPFYTWLRKNIPLELEQLLKQPGKFAQIKKAQGEIERLSVPPEEKYLPEWMQDRELYVRLPTEKEGMPQYMNFDFAFQDLARLNLKDPDVLREWVSSINPIYKLLFETLMNYSLFHGRNIVDMNLPEDVQFREAMEQSLLNDLRISGYYKRVKKEDIPAVHKIFDILFGLKPYTYDENKQRYWYYQRQSREKSALRRKEVKQTEKNLQDLREKTLKELVK